MNNAESISYQPDIEHISSGVASQTLWALVAKVIAALLTAATMVVVTRKLSASQLGTFSLVLSLEAFWLLFADFGISVSVSKHVAQYRRENSALASAFVFYGLLLQAGFAVLAASVFYLSGEHVAHFLNATVANTLLKVAAIMVVLEALLYFLQSSFQGFRRLELLAFTEVSRDLTKLGGTVVLLNVGLGIVGALAGRAIGFGAAAAMGLYVVWRMSMRGVRRRGAESHTVITQVMELSLPVLLIAGCDYAYREATVPLLSFFLDQEQVGYYSLPLRTTVMLMMPAHALALAVTPRLAALPRNEEAVRNLFLGAVRTILLVYIPAAFGLAALAPEMISVVFGREYLPSSPVMRLYAVYLLSVSIGVLVSLGLIYLGRARVRAGIMVCTALANIGLNLILIPRLGIVGAAVTMLVTYVPTVLIWLVIACRTIKLPLRELANMALKIGCCGLVMGALVYLIGHNGYSIVRLSITVVGGAVIYAATLFVARIVTPDELRKIIAQRSVVK